MHTLQELLHLLDDHCSVNLWSLTNFRHRSEFLDTEQSDYLKSELTRTGNNDLASTIVEETEGIIKTIEVFMCEIRPSIFETASTLETCVERNQTAIYTDLPIIAKEFKALTGGSGTAAVKKRIEKLKAAVSPLRSDIKDFTTKWEALEPRIYDIRERLKGYDAADALDIALKQSNLMSIRISNMSSYLNFISTKGKECHEPLTALIEGFKDFAQLLAAVEKESVNILSSTGYGEKLFEEADDLEKAFKKVDDLIPSDEPVPAEPWPLKAPDSDSRCGIIAASYRWDQAPLPWKKGRRDHCLNINVPFAYPQGTIPQVLVSIENVNAAGSTVSSSFAFDIAVDKITTEGFVLSASTSEKSSQAVKDFRVRWMLLPEKDTRFKCGYVTCTSSGLQGRQKSRQVVEFANSLYKAPPKVLCWFTGIDVDCSNNADPELHISVEPLDITNKGFTMEFETIFASKVEFLSAAWVAFPDPEVVPLALGEKAVFASSWDECDIGKKTEVKTLSAPAAVNLASCSRICGFHSITTKGLKASGKFSPDIWVNPNGDTGFEVDYNPVGDQVFSGLGISLLAIYSPAASENGQTGSNLQYSSVSVEAIQQAAREAAAKSAAIIRQRDDEIARLNLEALNAANNITRLNEEVNSLRRKIQEGNDEHAATVKSLNSKIADLEGTVRDKDTTIAAKEKGTAAFRSALDSAQRSLMDTITKNTELQRLNSDLSNNIAPYPRRGGRVWIMFIVYGDRIVRDPVIIDRCYWYANTKEKFRISNEWFGCDPLPNLRKTGLVLYKYDDRNQIRYMNGWEGEERCFDNW